MPQSVGLFLGQPAQLAVVGTLDAVDLGADSQEAPINCLAGEDADAVELITDRAIARQALGALLVAIAGAGCVLAAWSL